MGLHTIDAPDDPGANAEFDAAPEGDGAEADAFDGLFGEDDAEADTGVEAKDDADFQEEDAPPTADVMANLPPEARAVLKRLQADYTRKTQELAAQRKTLAAERAALEAEQDAAVLAPPKKAVAKRIDPATLDPLDPAQLAAFIEQQVADRLAAERAPVAAAAQQRQAAAAVQKFAAEHPDLADLEDEIAALLEANEHLDLETAYYAVKGRKGGAGAGGPRVAVPPGRRAVARQLGGSGQRISHNDIPAAVRADPVRLMAWLERNAR